MSIKAIVAVELQLKKWVDELEELDFNSLKAISDFLFVFSEQVLALEKLFSRQEIIHAIEPIRQIAASSPFVKRAQCWPRGYAGDFETILYILQGKNKAPIDSLGYGIEAFFLSSPICTQHKNKVIRQSKLIAETLIRKPNACILSIGCGTSEDLYNCLPLIKTSTCNITLIDIDPEALLYSLYKLNEVREKVTTIEGNIYKVIKKLETRFDLILIGGVFDYLSDKVITVLLNSLCTKLITGGQLFFTNMSKGNPYRICMEYLADWILIERDIYDLESLIQKTAFKHSYTFEKDATGLTYLVTLQNNG